ncbi:MAG: patatin-like phospholipase family protein [Acidobacteria bacterium]|nr:patatin-like phospholipase family protein [Acidobacteriota bacterium]
MTHRCLLMASGGNRGAWYAGFLQPIQAAGIRFELLGGVSAGGIAAAWFAAGDAKALTDSWRQADRWRIALHPWLARGRRRTVDQLIQTITLKTMDLGAVLKAREEVLVVASRITGGSALRPKLGREVLDAGGAADTARLGLLLRATAFIPWVNGGRAAVAIDGARYLDGGLTGRVPLDTVAPGRFDEIWVAACSPNGRAELARQLAAWDRPERLVVLTPSETLPVGRWTMEWNRVSRAIELGRRDMERTIEQVRSTLGHVVPASLRR